MTTEAQFRENLLHNLRELKRVVTKSIRVNVEDVVVQYDVRDGWQCIHGPTGTCLISGGLTESNAWDSLRDSASIELVIGRKHS